MCSFMVRVVDLDHSKAYLRFINVSFMTVTVHLKNRLNCSDTDKHCCPALKFTNAS